MGMVVFLLCNSSYLLAQSVQFPRIIKGNYCEENAARLDNIKAGVKEDSSIITIARLGNSENSSVYNLKRLKIIKQFFSQYSFYSKTLVTAQGDRINGSGRVELYINGVLELVFELPPKANLKAGNCGY